MDTIPTVNDYVNNTKLRPWWNSTSRRSRSAAPVSQAPTQPLESETEQPDSGTNEADFRLPDRSSLCMMILANALLQFSAYVTVSSASAYAAYLGGSTVFAGLTIGIPNVFSGLVLIPVTKIDQGRYTRPLRIACASLILGNILHAVAYRANFLYLILIGRLVSGIGYVGFIICSDPRIVGIRRRMTLASWLVIGQSFGLAAGPFVCGLLYKVGFSNDVFNGFTSPGWVTSSIWLIFAIAIALIFQDLPRPNAAAESIEIGSATLARSPSHDESARVEQPAVETAWNITLPQWGAIFSMCYASGACFFVLGSFESAIPIYTAAAFGYSPYAAGNFIALGGIATLPFLLLSVRYAPRVQDRLTLAAGALIGLAGLLLALILLLAQKKVAVGGFYVCWLLVALGFNLASTCTLSLLSKQLPGAWNLRTSMAIQYSNYLGRVTGAVFGRAAVQIGMHNYIGVLIAVVGLGGLMNVVLWKDLKAKKG
ncbi:membrane transporter [Mycena latifolia]|nr:membrane transporter [Mycena latifolia]